MVVKVCNVGDGIPEGSPALPGTLIEGYAHGKPSACCSYLFPVDARPNLHWACHSMRDLIGKPIPNSCPILRT